MPRPGCAHEDIEKRSRTQGPRAAFGSWHAMLFASETRSFAADMAPWQLQGQRECKYWHTIAAVRDADVLKV